MLGERPADVVWQRQAVGLSALAADRQLTAGSACPWTDVRAGELRHRGAFPHGPANGPPRLDGAQVARRLADLLAVGSPMRLDALSRVAAPLSAQVAVTWS